MVPFSLFWDFVYSCVLLTLLDEQKGIIAKALADRRGLPLHPDLQNALKTSFVTSSPFGLNAGLFTMMSYVINSYANTFKLFSYIQICIFFAASSVFYIGFKNLIIGLENFSYSVLFVSLFFNTLLFLLIAMLRYYFPSMSIKYD